jgi:hypothetical protein
MKLIKMNKRTDNGIGTTSAACEANCIPGWTNPPSMGDLQTDRYR